MNYFNSLFALKWYVKINTWQITAIKFGSEGFFFPVCFALPAAKEHNFFSSITGKEQQIIAMTELYSTGLVLQHNSINQKSSYSQMCFKYFSKLNLTVLVCTELYNSLETTQRTITSHKALQGMTMHGFTLPCDTVPQDLGIIRHSGARLPHNEIQSGVINLWPPSSIWWTASIPGKKLKGELQWAQVSGWHLEELKIP